MVLRTLTEEEQSRRAHALGDARLREAEERKIAEEEARIRQTRESIERAEREAAEARKREEDERRKHEIYERAWLLLLPSIKEGWGLVIPEAGMHATPAIAYRSAGGTIVSDSPAADSLSKLVTSSS